MRIPALLAVFLLATPVMAMMPPGSYDAERKASKEIVVIEVTDVAGPENPAFGLCAVTGRVVGVERGERFHAGEEATIKVPCFEEFGEGTPIGGFLVQLAPLKAGAFGRAYIMDGDTSVQYYVQDAADAPAPTEPF